MLKMVHPPLDCFMRRVFTVVLAAVLLMDCTGCSLFASRYQTISVSSEPMGAQVTINGENAGTTPLEHSVRRNQETSILVRKDGYQPATRHTTKGLSSIGILDVVGGCIFLLPFLGLLSGGAWEQEPANVAVILSPEGK
jgi:hypothetical protein